MQKCINLDGKEDLNMSVHQSSNLGAMTSGLMLWALG